MGNEREAGRVRLYPSIFNSRRYYLVQLRKQIEHITDYYIKGQAEAILADYGCGNMPYRPLIEPKIKKYIGLDLAENKNADVHISSDGKIPLDDSSIHYVLSTQVLEHVENPLGYL